MAAEAARRRLHRARQDADQPDHLLHGRAGHRRRRRHEEGRPRRRQGAALLRGRLDASRWSSAWSWPTSIQPGAGFNADPATLDAKRGRRLREAWPRARRTTDFILHIIPRTFFDAFTGSGDLLQVLFVAVLFGYAMTHMGERRQHRAPGHRDRARTSSSRMMNALMKLAPHRRRRRDGVHHRPLRRRRAEAAGRC